MSWQAFFLNPALVWILIPLTAMLLGGIGEIYKRYCEHQERIAMIENGIHPDAPESTSRQV